MSLTLPTNCMHCNYMLCDDDNHIHDIMHMHDDLISACITASNVIPDTKQKKTKFQDGMLQLLMTEKLHFFGVAFGRT